MRIDRAEQKREARLAMRTHRPSVYLVTFVLLALLFVLELLSVKLLYPGESLTEIARDYLDSAQEEIPLPTTEREAQEYIDEYLARTRPQSVFGRILDIAINIVTLMLIAGFTLFCLNVSRGAEGSFGNLLDPFGIFFKVLWLNIVMVVLIFLWSLLFVIPGIVASYRYSFALYLLLDDPEKGALQCIRESKALTQGYKGQLFVLDLSFLGWFLLCAIPFVGIYVEPYYNITRANFYRRISGSAEAPAAEGPAA